MDGLGDLGGLVTPVAIATLVLGGAVGLLFQLGHERVSAERRARNESSAYDSIDLTGTWFGIWQTSVDGEDKYYEDTIHLDQRKNVVFLHNVELDTQLQAGYLWKGELRLYDNMHLVGWYMGTQVISKGSFYFVLHRQGDLLEGAWVGCGYDSDLMGGCAVFARTADRAAQAMERLKTDYKSSSVRRRR